MKNTNIIQSIDNLTKRIVTEVSDSTIPKMNEEGGSKFISKIRDFLLYLRKGLLKGEIQGMNKLPSNIKIAAKKFTVQKFLKTMDSEDRVKVKRINDKYFSKMTNNEWFSYILSYTTYLKAKMTKTPIEVQVKKMEVQYKNYTKKEKNTNLAIVFIIVLTLWLLIYYSMQTKAWSPKLNIPQEHEFIRKMTNQLGLQSSYDIKIPLITILIVAFVAGLYVAGEEAPEPSGNVEKEKTIENPETPKKKSSSSSKTNKPEPFIL